MTINVSKEKFEHLKISRAFDVNRLVEKSDISTKYKHSIKNVFSKTFPQIGSNQIRL